MIGLPKVKLCEVSECCFNREKQCHAGAILVGDGDHPACDTFTAGKNTCGIKEAVAEVGACKTDSCSFNSKLECTAPSVEIGHHGAHADCRTYKHR